MSHYDELLTIREVAEMLRVDDTTVRRWIQQQTIAALTIRTGKRHHLYRIPRAALNAILARRAHA